MTKKLRDASEESAVIRRRFARVFRERPWIELDARAASTCIAACIAGRDLDMAEKVFEQVFEGGVCKPDECRRRTRERVFDHWERNIPVAESDEFMRQDDERVRDHKNCGDVQRFIAMLREYERF